MNFLSEYIKYLWNAKGRHGIHSPFVYELVDVCLRLKPSPDFKAAVGALRNTLASDQTLVEVEDFGAGSRKLGSVRKVSSIYKTASCKGVYAKLLYQISAHYKPAKILEFGTSLGLGTIHLASGNPTLQKLISVDACRNTLAQAQKNVDFMKLDHVELVNRTFDAFLESESLKQAEKADLVYIDGHHDGEALKKYMRELQPLTHENTIFVLDDIRWSDSMLDAWKTLSGSEEFHLSMDFFRMGILVRRPGQVKEHFVIKLKNVISGF